MPVIEGADLTKVSTEFQPFDEGEYAGTIKSADFDDAKKNIIIVTKMDEAPDPSDIGKEFRDYVNIINNKGELNEIGLTQLKRYLEHVFGKGSPEAEATPPDSDPLVGHQVRFYLIPDSFERKDGTEGKKNKIKRFIK